MQGLTEGIWFTGWDWAIVGVYLALIVGIGISVKRLIRGVDSFIGAGKSVGIGLSIATMVGAELGLVTIAFAGQAGFTGGFAAIHIPVISMLMCLVIGMTGFIVYRLRKAGVITLPEYYQSRYGRKTRVVGGTILVIAGVLNMGLFLKASALFLGGVTGYDSPTAINVIMVALLLVVFIHTVVGGMLSVVLLDYLQFLLIGSSFIIVTLLCLSDARYVDGDGRAHTGYQAAVHAVAEHGERQAELARTRAAEAAGETMEAAAVAPAAAALPPALTAAERRAAREGGFNPLQGQGRFGIVYVLWMAFAMFSLLALWQPATLRALIAENPSVAKRTYFWSSLGFLIRFMIPVFWGVCALVFVMNRPELYARFFPPDGSAGVSTQLGTSMYLGYLLPAGLKGLVVAGLLAAYMSTQDAYLLCWSASITQDIVAPLSRKPLSQERRVLYTRICVVGLGLFLLAWGWLFPLESGLWEYMAITATVYSAGAFAAIGGGLYWKKASSTGANIAMGAGALALLAIVPWSRMGIESIWLSAPVLGLGVPFLALGGLVAGSLIWPDRNANKEGIEA